MEPGWKCQDLPPDATTHTSCHSCVSQPCHPGRDGSDWGILLGNLQRPLYLVFKKVDSSHPHPHSIPSKQFYWRHLAQSRGWGPGLLFSSALFFPQNSGVVTHWDQRVCSSLLRYCPILSTITDTEDRLVATGQEEKLPGRHLLLFVFPKVSPLESILVGLQEGTKVREWGREVHLRSGVA